MAKYERPELDNPLCPMPRESGIVDIAIPDPDRADPARTPESNKHKDEHRGLAGPTEYMSPKREE